MRLLTLALSGLLAACGSSAPTPAPTPAQTTPGTAEGTVHDLRALAGNRWSTATLTIEVGDAVKVTDVDPDAPHNFVVEGVGRSQTMNNGDVFTLRFDRAGAYAFVCTFHEEQGMAGTVTVG